MQLLNSCCVFIGLKNGCLTIGIGTAIFFTLGITVLYLAPTEYYPYLKRQTTSATTRFFTAIDSYIWVVLSIVLIMGALKENLKSILCWLIGSALIMIISLAGMIVIMARDFIDKEYLSGSLVIVIALLEIGIFIYLWLVVFSFFQKLRNGETIA